jgi:cytochrome bd-type quinol oxidase subunit 2
MNTSEQSEARTRAFARVLGPYLVIVTITAVARTSQMRTLASEFGANSVWAFVTGAFILLSGLIVVALHQYWRGVPAIIVSVLGWMTTIKGLALLAFPQAYISTVNSAVDAVWWRIGFVVIALVGLYLTYVGWAPAPNRPAPQAASKAPDLPRAA